MDNRIILEIRYYYIIYNSSKLVHQQVYFSSVNMYFLIQCTYLILGTVKWSHIETFYNMDKSNANFVYAPALTEHHIHPNLKQQMRVKLAAQVFSHSVAAGMFAKIVSSK